MRPAVVSQLQTWWLHMTEFLVVKVQLSKPSPILLIRMNNRLKEFEELLLDNTLIKVQNQALGDRNPKWNEWW